MNKIIFTCPPLSASGGVKVILRLTEFLRKLGYDANILLDHSLDVTNLSWAYSEATKISPYIYSHITLNKDGRLLSFFKDSIVVSYLEGRLDLVPKNIYKHILLLQGYGIHRNVELNKQNIKYPFSGVICVSSWLKAIAKQFHKEVHIMYPGVDTEFIPKATVNAKFTIGANLHDAPDKNARRVFSVMNRYGSRCFGKFYGSLEGASSFIKKLETSNFEYSLTHSPNFECLPLMYYGCNVWLSTSLNEGFGIPPFEAMACGVPVVLVRNNGSKDLCIDNYNCKIVEDSDSSIMHAIYEISKDKELRSKLISNGLFTAKKLTWENACNSFISAVEIVC